MFKTNNNKGMAMIVAVVMALAFLMLVLTVSLLSTTAYKRAHFRRDRVITLNLAESGIADALYRMNYLNYQTATGSYSTTFPFTTSDSLVSGGEYTVDFDTLTKELSSTGKFKGRQRKIKVGGRGATGNINGIAEAFNKHAVYAKTVNLGATPTTVTGNVITESADPGTVAGRTWTQMAANTLGAVPAPVDINSDITADPGVGGGAERYQDGDDLLITNPPDGAPYDFETKYGPAGGSYNGAGTYTFSGNTISANIETLNGADGPGNIIFSGANTVNNFVRANSGTITLGGTLTINSGGAFLGAGSIIINGANIDGAGTGALAIRNSDVAFSGAFSTIDTSAAGNTKKGAVMLYDTLGNNSLTIDANFAPNITLKNDDSQAAIIVYSTAEITAANPVAINDAPIINLGSNNQPAAIIVYSTTDNANLTINTPADTIDGLIYVGSGGDSTKNATITLTDGTIGSSTLGGTVIAGGTVTNPANRANGTVNLNGGAINWKKRNYTATSNVFQNFSGGQRVYLPVIGSWKETK